MSVSTSVVKSPQDVVNDTDTDESYPKVFQTPDSTGLEAEDASSVAMVMGRDSSDVDRAPDSQEVVKSWDSKDEEERINSREKRPFVTCQSQCAE